MAPKDGKKVTVVAECSLSSPEGVETVRCFDKAWQRAMELPLPVEISFVGFVRA